MWSESSPEPKPHRVAERRPLRAPQSPPAHVAVALRDRLGHPHRLRGLRRSMGAEKLRRARRGVIGHVFLAPVGCRCRSVTKKQPQPLSASPVTCRSTPSAARLSPYIVVATEAALAAPWLKQAFSPAIGFACALAQPAVSLCLPKE